MISGSTARLSAIGFGARLAAIVLGTVNLVIVARVLGPSGRGEYVLALTALTVLAVLTDAGLPMSAQSLAGGLGGDAGRLHRLLITAVVPVTAVAWLVAALVVAVGGRAVFAGVDDESMLLVLATLPFAIYGRYWTALMVGLRRIVDAAAGQIVFSAGLLALDVVLLILIPGGVHGAMVAYLTASLCQAAFMFVRAPRASGEDATPSRELLRNVLMFGLRSYPVTLASLAWSAFPQLALNVVGGAAFVGWFSLAQQLAERFQLPALALQDTAFSRMSSAMREDAAVTTERYTRVIAIVSALAAVVAIGCAPVVLPWVFGASFAPAIAPFQILMAVMPLTGVGILLTPYVVAHARRPGLLSVVTWVQVFVLIGCAILIGSQLDATLMAFASALAQVAAFIAMVVAFGRLSSRSPLGLLTFGLTDLRVARDVLRVAMGR